MNAAEKLKAFWAQFDRKTWVVRLDKFGRGNSIIDCERRYVNARTKAGAIMTAREVTWMKGRIKASARLAHPVNDLGCVWTGEGKSPL